jgi:alpha-L-fucosidase
MPVPTDDQLAYQRLYLTAFFHFGPNTFDGDEVGDGTASPTIFNPTALDASQWVSTMKNAGFKQGILVVKHHDGFCLWPTKCSDYNVSKSPWKNGQGDVIKEFTDAAHAANFRAGLYLSPLDNHAADSSGSAGYGQKFTCMVDEILQNYGRIDEIWFDGNSAPSSVGASLYAHIKQISPHTLIFTGPEIAATGVDLRWVGNEGGNAPAGETSVQTLNGKQIWYPSESDVSIRGQWFYHAGDTTKSLQQLTDIFFSSVGHNSTLLLNVPPNQDGVLAPEDVARVGQFGASIHNLFTTNLASGRAVTGDSVFQATDYAASKAVDGDLDTFWAAGAGKTSGRLEVDLGSSQAIKIIDISEPIALGERSSRYHVEIQAAGATSWTTIGSGTVIGARNLIRGTWTAQKVALVIEQGRGVPAIAEFGIY